MKSIISIALSLLIALTVQAQSLKKSPIGHSGCQAYFFCDVNVENSFSEDSSIVYTNACTGKDSLEYGLICVQLKEKISDIQVAENVMISYLDYLKTSFSITKSTGYGKGHTLKNYPAAHGVIDYWSDNKDQDWKVKGWTDGQFIAVLYVISPKDQPNTESKINLYLDGFRFPGMQ